jgi:hypothetical protein
MSLRELFENAENCAHLAEEVKDAPSRRRYERMHASWLALIESEAWLEENVTPVVSSSDPLELLLATQD